MYTSPMCCLGNRKDPLRECWDCPKKEKRSLPRQGWSHKAGLRGVPPLLHQDPWASVEPSFGLRTGSRRRRLNGLSRNEWSTNGGLNPGDGLNMAHTWNHQFHIYIYMDITWIDNADNAHEIDKQGLKQQHIILHLTLYILALCTTD